MDHVNELKYGPYFDDSQDVAGGYDVQISWVYEPRYLTIKSGSLEDSSMKILMKNININNFAMLYRLSKNYFGVGLNLELYKAVLAFCIRERDQMRRLSVFEEDAKGYDNLFNLESDLFEFGPIYPDSIRQKAVRHYLSKSWAALDNAKYLKARVYADRARFLNMWATVGQFQEIDNCLSKIPNPESKQLDEIWED